MLFTNEHKSSPAIIDRKQIIFIKVLLVQHGYEYKCFLLFEFHGINLKVRRKTVAKIIYINYGYYIFIKYSESQ